MLKNNLLKKSPTNSEINDFDDKNYLSNSQSVYHSEMSKLLHTSNYPSHNNNNMNLSTSSLTYSMFDNNTQIYENSEKKLNSMLKVRQINQQTKIFELNQIIQDYQKEMFELQNKIANYEYNHHDTSINEKIEQIKKEIELTKSENMSIAKENNRLSQENQELNKIFKEKLQQKKNAKITEKAIPHKYISRKYSFLKPLETNVEQIFDLNSSKESNSNSLFD